MKKVHRLKTDPEVFAKSVAGIKRYEIRFDDRGFAVGDFLILLETRFSGAAMRAGMALEFTGRELLLEVTDVLDGYGLQPGWVILSVDQVSPFKALIEGLSDDQA